VDKSPALAVIGTAGRQDDASKLSSLGPNFYESMFERVRDAAIDWQVTHAVSGGAAYADHLAVRGYLEGLFKSLTLFSAASLVVQGEVRRCYRGIQLQSHQKLI
jgi:hypothetical protein